MEKTFRFEARIQPGDGGGAFVYFPFDVAQEFGMRGRVPVKTTIDEIPFTGFLIKYGGPQHMLPVLKRVREQIGKHVGDEVAIELQLDLTERKVEVPGELAACLKREGLLDAFKKLSDSHQREYCHWISEAKKEGTRHNRAAKAIDMLRKGVKTPDRPRPS